jgi:FdhD protein
METKPGHTVVYLHRYERGGEWSHREDVVAAEEPLEIQLLQCGEDRQAARTLAITMRTPGQDEDLATGFLFSEGIIIRAEQVVGMYPLPVRRTDGQGHTLLVELAGDVKLDWERLQRHFYVSSSCGVCGKASIEAVIQAAPETPFPMVPQVSAHAITRLPGRLRAAQQLFEETGGIHGCGIFDAAGDMVVVREDVGRHNAADKALGALLRHRTPKPDQWIGVLSGRASFELVQKFFMAGVPVLVAVGAPSSLAVSLAEEAGMTLIGFTSAEHFNVYSGRQRIVGG